VTSIDFDLSQVDDGVLLITIHYRIRASNESHNLVYPFYLIPAEELA
jgi:hypothetical protein